MRQSKIMRGRRGGHVRRKKRKILHKCRRCDFFKKRELDYVCLYDGHIASCVGYLSLWGCPKNKDEGLE